MIPWNSCFATHTLARHATDELHIKIQAKLSKMHNCFWTSYDYTQTLRHSSSSHVLWYMSLIMVNMLNKGIPDDVRNVTNKGLCVSETLWPIERDLLVQLRVLIDSCNCWMTGKIGFESECCICQSLDLEFITGLYMSIYTARTSPLTFSLSFHMPLLLWLICDLFYNISSHRPVPHLPHPAPNLKCFPAISSQKLRFKKRLPKKLRFSIHFGFLWKFRLELRSTSA